MPFEYRDALFPELYPDKSTGEEKTAWKPSGFTFKIDWQLGKVAVRYAGWPKGLWAMGFEQRSKSTNQRGASGYNQAPQGQTQERPLVQEAEDESLPF